MNKLPDGPHAPLQRTTTFRFYEELNDFLPDKWRKKAFGYTFTRTPSIKDTIEAIGVPHTEVDLILVDGKSVDFGFRLSGGERVAVYPMFERFDITPLNRLRAQPLRDIRFVLDVHLGKLARYLRMLGLDAKYDKDYDDETIISLSEREHRIILTRDRGILKHGSVSHGHWIRETDPEAQLREIVIAFDLRTRFRPFTRCMNCNGEIHAIAQGDITGKVPDRIRASYDNFSMCRSCERIYWPGSHFDRMTDLIERLKVE